MNSFLHSGHIGDCLYSLPCVKALGGGAYYLRTEVPIGTSEEHPLGGIGLSTSWASALLPLLRAQPYISGAELWNGQPLTHDLNWFRSLPIDFRCNNVSNWYFLTFGCHMDLSFPWLKVAPLPSGNILVNRTGRYRAGVSYAFLRDYPDVCFVGLEEEYREFLREVPGCPWVKTTDFLELARVIAGCRLFVGNQSSCFAIAEGLKVRRVLELCPTCPNVMAFGAQGQEVMTQAGLERAVATLANDCVKP